MHAINLHKYAGLAVLLGTMMLFSHQRFINLQDAVPHGWVAYVLHAILLIIAGFLLTDKQWELKKLGLSVSFFPKIFVTLLIMNIILISVYHPEDPVFPSINQNVFPVASLMTLVLLPFGWSYVFITKLVTDARLSKKSILLCDFLLLILWLLLYPVIHLIAITLVSWIL